MERETFVRVQHVQSGPQVEPVDPFLVEGTVTVGTQRVGVRVGQP